MISQNSTNQEPYISPKIFTWFFIVALVWKTLGGYYDLFFHLQEAEVLETFFTPSHYFLYAGFTAMALVTFITLFLNHRGGLQWSDALPVGYNLTLIGIILFGIGGFADLIWHERFGFEVDVEALYSPTHLILVVADGLIIAGPIRHALRRDTDLRNQDWIYSLPVVLGFSFFLSMLTYFTPLSHPLSVIYATEPTSDIFLERRHIDALGTSSVILQSIFLVSVLIVAILNFEFKFGSLAIIVAINGIIMSAIAENWTMIIVSLLGALSTELLYQFYVRSNNQYRLQLFGLAVPILFYSIYFGTLLIVDTVYWSIDLWLGSIVLGGSVGLLASFFISTTQLKGDSRTTPG